MIDVTQVGDLPGTTVDQGIEVPPVPLPQACGPTEASFRIAPLKQASHKVSRVRLSGARAGLERAGEEMPEKKPSVCLV